MANLGSEISRYFSYINNGQIELADKCLVRADEILNKVMVLPEVQPRVYEFKIVAGVIGSLKDSPKWREAEEKNLKNYFMPFAERIVN